MDFRKFTSVAILTAALALSAGSAHGQTSKGILVGVVRDSSGAVIPNATVKIVGNSDGAVRTITTKGDGSYRIEALDPENYTVTASQTGFAGYSAANVIVSPSQVTTYDVKLSIGGANDVVSVEADSISINTENGQLTGLVNSTDLAKLPIFSLNPYELATTVPGAQVVSNSGFSNGQGLQVNGARPRANNFLLDSQEINDVGIGGQAFQPTIPDSFESVAVLTSAASAEYGRAGGAVVNLVTKQGTNAYHGSVYERYAGSGINALGGQERGSDNPKARFNTHTYGFTAGGPIFKDKLFVFGGLELQRYYGSQTANLLQLPDASGYATLQKIGGPQVALLSQYLSNGSYLTTYNQVAGRTVVTTNVGPQNGCPTTGCIITTNTFQRPNASTSNPDTQWTYRVDYKPWEKDSVGFRYLHDRSSFSPDFQNNGSALAGFDTQQGGPAELGAGYWTHIFGPNVINEFRVAETRLSFAFAPTAATQANPLFALQTINISGLPSLGPNQNFPQGRGEDLYQLQDTVGWTKGRQSLRIGFDIGRQLEKDLVSQNAKGTLTFAKGGTNANGVSYISALGNFLQNQLGPSGTATRTFGPTRIDPHGWRSGFFAQDDIKLNADLTVNIGIRYDYLTNPENSLQYPGIDPTNPLGILVAPTAVGQPATATVNKIKNDKNNVSPRFGFAYAPHAGGLFADGKSVIRGGFGIFYDSDFSNFVTNAAQTAPNAPTGTLISTTGAGLANATSLVSTIPANLTLTSSVTSVVTNMVNPVTYQYNLGVEHQFPANIFLAIRYVGSRSNKLFANQQYNYFSGLTGKRLNPNYGAIVARGNFADSNYNSLQVEGAHLFSHGFQIRANYTYSKTLDDGSEIFTPDGSDTSYTANLAPGGRRQDYGPSAYDHRHYAVISYVWSPVGLHTTNAIGNAALGLLTRHWTVSGTSRFQSGIYGNFGTYGIDINGDGSSTNDRAIVSNKNAPLESGGIDGAFVGGTTGTYYDLATVNGPVGNLVVVNPSNVHFLIPYGPNNQYLSQEIGRNSYSNPGSMNNDLALEKGVGLSYLHLERGKLVLRAEVQNIANHNNIGYLDSRVTDIGTGNFLNRKNGLEDAGRQMFLWAKIQF
jgi:hypothetical protein